MKNEQSDINLQEDGYETVTITDDSGKQHLFEVILHVPFEEKHYVILHPLDKYPGLDEDTCAIFEMQVQENSDTATLIPETDDDILDSIYAIYVQWATEQQSAEGCNGNCDGCPGCN